MIDDPTSFWAKHGFVEMVPPIRLPTTPDERDRIQVWLKVPAGAPIEVERIDAQARWALRFPPGTVADRVESSCEGPDPHACTPRVVDVRGTRFAPGAEWFHVFEPDPAAPAARLLGYEWRRGDEPAHEAATTALVALLQPHTLAHARRFTRLNQCAGCHPHDKPEARRAGEPMPRRPTDGSGLYVPGSVLLDAAPTEIHRPWDENVDRPFVQVSCPGGAAALDTRFGRRWSCPDGSVPIARLDLARALAARDPHALAVCASRRYLFDHLSAEGRAAFAASFRECHLPTDSSKR